MTSTATSLTKRQLFVMRHAKSSWNEPGLTDFQRPLNARGRLAAPLMGQRLQAAGVQVDIILASTAQRVRETVQWLETTWKHGGQVVWEPAVYLADPQTLASQLAVLDDAWPRVMLIGHNPGISDFVTVLAQTPVDLPTAAIAILDGPALPWSRAVKERAWSQRDYWTPKD